MFDGSMMDDGSLIDGQKFFDQPLKTNLRAYDNIRKIATAQEDDYITACLIDFKYFKNCYKIALDADPKAI